VVVVEVELFLVQQEVGVEVENIAGVPRRCPFNLIRLLLEPVRLKMLLVQQKPTVLSQELVFL
jgi:hypothetical protein